MTDPTKRKRYLRRWSTEQKLRILKEAKAIQEEQKQTGNRGGIADLLERYNLDDAFLAVWRRTLKKQGLWQ